MGAVRVIGCSEDRAWHVFLTSYRHLEIITRGACDVGARNTASDRETRSSLETIIAQRDVARMTADLT